MQQPIMDCESMDVDMVSPTERGFSAILQESIHEIEVQKNVIQGDHPRSEADRPPLSSEVPILSRLDSSLYSSDSNFGHINDRSEHGIAGITSYRSEARSAEEDGSTTGEQSGGAEDEEEKGRRVTATICPPHTKAAHPHAHAHASAPFTTSSTSLLFAGSIPRPDLTPRSSSSVIVSPRSTSEHYHRLTPEERVAAYALPLLALEQYPSSPSGSEKTRTRPVEEIAEKAQAQEQYGQGLRTGANTLVSRHRGHLGASSSNSVLSDRSSHQNNSNCNNNNSATGGAREEHSFENQVDESPLSRASAKRKRAPVPIPLPYASPTNFHPASNTGRSLSHRTHGYSPFPIQRSPHNRARSASASATRNFFGSRSANNLLSSSSTSSTPSFTTPPWCSMSTATSSVIVEGGIPSTPIISKTPATPGSSGGSSRINSPGMSLARKRRAPAWPSPRTDLPSAARDLSTMYTPAALKVPPTAQYSPAFHRSGYAAPPPRLKSPLEAGRPISASAPMPSAAKLPMAGMIPTGRVKVSGIPQDYIVNQLNSLAKKFWFDPSSADCTVLVPVPRKASPPPEPPNSAVSVHSNQPGRSFWPPTPVAPDLAGSVAAQPEGKAENVLSSHRVTRGRRGSLPEEQSVPVLAFPLHKDYLITQSSLFRSLLSASPLAHLNLPPPTSPRRAHARTQSMAAPPTSAGQAASSFIANQKAMLARKGARVLPQKQGEGAMVFVPLPDPGSFGVIVHWLYWGNVSALESALNKGLVTWQGIVKNIEYLGLDDNVKRVMGKWWRKWVKTEGGRRVSEGDADRRKRRGAGWKRKTMGGVEGLEEWDDDDDSEEEYESEDERREISPLPSRGADAGGGDEEVSGLLKAL